MEYVFILLFLTMLISIFAWVLMTLIYRGHILRLDEIIIGHRPFADIHLHRMHRATDYGFACTFEVIARRTHPTVDFDSIPEDLKRPFKVMCVLLTTSLVCLIVGSVWTVFFW